MKPYVVGITVIVLMVLGLIWSTNLGSKPSASRTEVSVSTSTIATTTATYTIHLDFPVFGISNADKRVKSIIDDVLVDFTMLPPNPTPITAENELDGQFDHVYVGTDFISARMLIYEFTGGAHGGTIAYGLNFHTDGSEVSLDEALALIGKSLQEVSDEARRQLTERFEMVQFPEGVAASPENFATFVISKDSVTFIFQQYQVEAYAAGMPEISFQRVQ